MTTNIRLMRLKDINCIVKLYASMQIAPETVTYYKLSRCYTDCYDFKNK